MSCCKWHLCMNDFFNIDTYNIQTMLYQEGIAHLVPPLPPNPFTRVRIRGEAFGRIWRPRAFGWGFPSPPGLLAHLGCTPAIGAQWVAPLTGIKKNTNYVVDMSII